MHIYIYIYIMNIFFQYKNAATWKELADHRTPILANDVHSLVVSLAFYCDGCSTIVAAKANNRRREYSCESCTWSVSFCRRQLSGQHFEIEEHPGRHSCSASCTWSYSANSKNIVKILQNSRVLWANQATSTKLLTFNEAKEALKPEQDISFLNPKWINKVLTEIKSVHSKCCSVDHAISQSLQVRDIIAIDLEDFVMRIEAGKTNCDWETDRKNNLIRVHLKAEAFSNFDLKTLTLAMEKSNLTVVSGGHCKGLDSNLWSPKALSSADLGRRHHLFRHFKQHSVKNKPAVMVEMKGDVAMPVQKYFEYLEKRRAALTSNENHDRSFCLHTQQEATKIKCDVLEDVIYMLDYSMKEHQLGFYNQFLDTFAFPHFLPGGSMCAMKAVSREENSCQTSRACHPIANNSN
jgi:hypothetical protein